MPSATYLRLSDVSVIFRVTYFHFSNTVCFLYIGRQAALHCDVLILIRNIGHRTMPKI